MGTQPTDTPDDTSRPSTGMLIAMIGDTTWRMFVPTIGLLLLGNAADEAYHTAPWLMLAGALVGGGIAILLVKRQLAR